MSVAATQNSRTMLNKVPAVTLVFWIIKILSTTVGETGADLLIFKLHWGLALTSLVMLLPLLLIVILQLRATRYVPWIYWSTVVMISIVGTLITDNLVDNLGVSLEATSIAFSVLLVLILRTIAIEFRSHRESPRWRSTWDWFFFASSLGITLLLGVALGNVIRGIPLDSSGQVTLKLVDLLNPYSLAVGVTAVAMLSLHGGIFLTLKVDGELRGRIERLVPRLMVAFFALMTVLVVWTLLLRTEVTATYRDRVWIAAFPVLALVSTVVAWRLIRAGHFLPAFGASALTIALLMATVAAGMYPVMLPSSIDSSYDLTVHNAASAPETLTVMTVIAVIGIPFVLLYTAGVYYFFRGRVVLDDHGY